MRAAFIALLIFPAITLTAQNHPDSAGFLTHYVDPFIGTDAHGHTYPGASAPFGMVQLSPDTRLEGWDGCSGYHYSDSLIYGFSHTHLSGTGVPDYGDILLQPYLGEVRFEPQAYAAPFDKNNERAEPGYYAVRLNRGVTNEIAVELTASERVGVHRYVFPAAQEMAHLLIDLRHRDQVLASGLEVVGDRELAGHRFSNAWAKDQRLYFVIRFSRPFINPKIVDLIEDPHVISQDASSKALVGLLDFHNYEGMPIVAAVALSAVSVENARQNLEAECGDLDFNRIKAETQQYWERQLSKIEVDGGTDAQKRTFYTALYHTMLAPNLYSDVNGDYRGRDQQIHHADHPVYTVFSLWDTYRACNPLYTILEPGRTNAFIQTFLRQYEQGGLLPVWELSACETDCMIGNHAIPVIADAWAKGIRGYDGNLALEAMLTSARQDRLGLVHYKAIGYIPSDEEPESVSKTLEYAYDDWCIARMAQDMGKKEIAEEFFSRAQNYKNSFDPTTGFFRAKNNSTWHTPFDPFEVNFNYTEANAWQYRFAAPQDVSGMMRLLGGKDAFATALDSLFTARPVTTGRQQADITGLIGQYVQGNEPSHHMAYLYNYAGQPWKTQQRVRQILDEQYTDRPDGLSGNEDCGQMSAWYVLSALGFYPVTPGSPEYAIGTPLFEKATLHLDNGKTLTIRAEGVSGSQPFIQRATRNGAEWPKTWFTHSDILAGGEFRFEMGDQPSGWGRRPEDCPVSAITTREIAPIPFFTEAQRVFQDSQLIRIGCVDTTGVLRYRLDTDTLGDRPYREPFTIWENTNIQVTNYHPDGRTSAVARAQFLKLRSDLRVVRYAHPFSPQYTGGGEQGLVDLLPGGADFRSGRWQGYEGVDLDVVIDLGSIKPVRTVSANFLQDENSWIFFPKAIRVEVSADGERFEPAGTLQNEVSPLTPGSLQQKFTVELSNRSARYVRLIGENLGNCPEGHKGAGYPCWLFADEVYID